MIFHMKLNDFLLTKMNRLFINNYVYRYLFVAF